jgi:hypothetical protein
MYPHAIPLWTDKPLWLDGPFLLVDKDYCYGRLAVVSDVDDGGFALNVDKRVGEICRAISKQVQRSDARIEVDVMHTGNECTEQVQRMYLKCRA